MNLVDLFLLILILSASLFCIFAILYLKRLVKQFESVRTDIHHLVINTIPVMNNLEKITRSLNRIVHGAEGYWVALDDSISNLRERLLIIASWKIFHFIKTNASGFIRNFKSIRKGISAF